MSISLAYNFEIQSKILYFLEAIKIFRWNFQGMLKTPFAVNSEIFVKKSLSVVDREIAFCPVGHCLWYIMCMHREAV